MKQTCAEKIRTSLLKLPSKAPVLHANKTLAYACNVQRRREAGSGSTIPTAKEPGHGEFPRRSSPAFH